MRRSRFLLVCFVVLVLLTACGSPSLERSLKTSPAAIGTPPAIPSCEPSFKHLAEIEGQWSSLALSGVSKAEAFYAAYFQGGHIHGDGSVERISFDAAADQAILHAYGIAKDQAWFLRREPWFFDGTDAKPVPMPAGIHVDSLGVGGGQVWAGGKEGDAPAVLRRDGDQWKRVPFSIARFEHLRVDVARDGTPYLSVDQVVPPPPAKPGEVQTLGLKTEGSVWTLNGESWDEIAAPDYVRGIIPGNDGVLYAIGPDIEVRRFFGGTWTTVPFVQPETGRVLVMGADVDAAGRLWITGLHTTVEGATSDFWLLDGESIRRIPLPAQAKARQVGSISAAPDGSIWFSAETQVFRGGCS